MTKASPFIYYVHVFSAVEHANQHRILLDKENSRLPETITIFLYFLFFFFFFSLFDELISQEWFVL